MGPRAMRLTIDDWRKCLLACGDVEAVDPVVQPDGTSRKSWVPESAVARGGGHLCPHELYVYIGGRFKANRVTMGFTKHGNFLHTYYRTPSQRIGETRAHEVFAAACKLFDTLAAAPEEPREADIPPMPRRPPPSAPQTKRCLMAWKDASPEYLELNVGDAIEDVPAPIGVDDCGWAFARNLTTEAEGWYPPDFVR